MLLMLISEENSSLFSFVNDEETLVKKMVGYFNLDKFLLRDNKGLEAVSLYLIDYNSIENSERDMINLIATYKHIHDVPFIIYTEDETSEQRLFKYKESIFGTDHIVICNSIGDVKQNLTKFIRESDFIVVPTEESFDKIEDEILEVEENKADGLVIAITGLHPRAGATTFGVSMARFIKKYKEKVSYVEGTQNKQIRSFIKEDINNGNANYYEHEGIYYYPAVAELVAENYDFNIIDVGLFEQTNVPAFLTADIPVICSASKPNEIHQLQQWMEKIKDHNPTKTVYVIFTFANEEDKTTIRKLFVGQNVQVYFSNYQPDIFDVEPNKLIYFNLFEDFHLRNLSVNMDVLLKDFLDEKQIESQREKKETFWNLTQKSTKIETIIRVPEAVTIPQKVITIMNIHPRAGAKFIATNLARILSEYGFYNGVIEFDFKEPRLYELLNGDKHAPDGYVPWHKQIKRDGLIKLGEQWVTGKTTWIPVGKESISPWGVEETIRILLYAKQAPILFCTVSTYDDAEVINELMKVSNEVWFVTEDSIVQINTYLKNIEETYMKHHLDKSIIIGNRWSDLIKDIQKEYKFDHLIKDFGAVSKIAEYEGHFLFDLKEIKDDVLKAFKPLVERVIPNFERYYAPSKKRFMQNIFRRRT